MSTLTGSIRIQSRQLFTEDHDTPICRHLDRTGKTLRLATMTMMVTCLLLFNIANSYADLSVHAVTCSLEDIKAAVDEVYDGGGGTVYVPAGQSTHTDVLKMPDGVSLIGAGDGQTIITNARIRILPIYYGDLDKPFRVSGLSLPGDSSIQVRGVENFRIDHVTICNGKGGTIISVMESQSGVIDHCNVLGVNATYGIAVTMGYDVLVEDWVEDATKMMGSASAIFIEDNSIDGCGHGIVGHGHAHYVARYNLFTGHRGHALDAHGNGYGPPCGTRLVEVYNNTFRDPEYAWKALGIRGGSAVVFNNVIDSYDNGVGLHLEPHSPEHLNMAPHDIWIWDNTFIDLGGNGEDGDSCSRGDYLDGNPHCNEVFVWDISETGDVHAQDVIQEDRDFFLRAPTLEEDGFEYEPYTYPHPLTTLEIPMPSTDTEAPDIPMNVTAEVVACNQIELSWDASTDNVGVDEYDVRRNGEIVAGVTGTSYMDQGLAQESSFTYTVEARDAAGNRSGESVAVFADTMTCTVDTALVSFDIVDSTGEFGDKPYLYDKDVTTHSWIHSDGFWEFNLEGSREISLVRFYNRWAGTTIRVLVGETEVYSGELAVSEEWIEIAFPPVSGDAVRIEGTHTWAGVSFYEVEVWGTADDSFVPSAAETQHTIVDSTGEFGDKPYLYDKDVTTHSWIHPYGFWEFNLEGSREISLVRFYNRWAGTTIRVLVGETEVYSGELAVSEEWIEIAFPSVSGDAVRIEGTHTWAGVSFYEVEIWGSEQ